MTTGIKEIGPTGTCLKSEYTYNCVTGSTVNLGTDPSGSYFYKQWSGTNDPPTKPTIDYFTYFFKGRMWTVKRRSIGGVPVRKHRTDHPYQMSFIKWSSGEYTLREMGTCNIGSPPVPTLTLRRELKGDTKANRGNGVSFTYKWDSNSDLALIGKLREAVAGSDFNMGVFLGESKEALHMIAQTATTIFRTVTALRKGNVAGAFQALGLKQRSMKSLPPRFSTKENLERQAASRWLELQYGWLPLLSDCKNAAEFLAQYHAVGYSTEYRVRMKVPALVTFDKENVYNQLYAKSTGQIIARLTEINVPKMAGLMDPLSVAWELVPFSFVADWFIPIGSYLSARGLASALTGSFVTTRKDEYEIQLTGRKPANSGLSTFYNLHYWRKEMVMSRTISSSLSVPRPTVKSFDKIASWRHAANAVALATQMFVGR